MKTKQITIIKNQDLTWYDVACPGEKEFNFLRKHFTFHPLDLQDCITPVQRPRLHDYEDYLFIILRLPVYNKEEKTIAASEMDIFVGQNFVVTIHRGKMTTHQSFVQECKNMDQMRELYLSHGSGYLLYEIFKRMFDRCYPLLDSVGAEIERVEQKIYKGNFEEVVKMTSNIKRNVINLRKILRAHLQVIKKVMASEHFFLNLDRILIYRRPISFKDIYEDINDIWDILSVHADTIFALDQTNESLISHRINQVIKALTIVSSIFLPATLIINFFGMSFGNAPLIHTTSGIFIVVLSIFLISTVMLLVFKKKKWL